MSLRAICVSLRRGVFLRNCHGCKKEPHLHSHASLTLIALSLLPTGLHWGNSLLLQSAPFLHTRFRLGSEPHPLHSIAVPSSSRPIYPQCDLWWWIHVCCLLPPSCRLWQYSSADYAHRASWKAPPKHQWQSYQTMLSLTLHFPSPAAEPNATLLSLPSPIDCSQQPQWPITDPGVASRVRVSWQCIGTLPSIDRLAVPRSDRRMSYFGRGLGPIIGHVRDRLESFPSCRFRQEGSEGYWYRLLSKHGWFFPAWPLCKSFCGHASKPSHLRLPGLFS